MDGIERVRKTFEAAAVEPQVVITHGVGEAGAAQARAELERRVADNAKPHAPPAIPALPIIAAPRLVGAFMISAIDGATDAGWYGFVQKVNLLVFAVTLCMATWLTLRAPA